MCNTCAKQITCTERKQNCTEKITYVQAGILEQPKGEEMLKIKNNKIGDEKNRNIYNG